MDRITRSLLAGFVREHNAETRQESEQFEAFASFSVVRRHYSANFSPFSTVCRGGGDCGIDAIVLILNGQIVDDENSAQEICEAADTISLTYIFVQAERSSEYDGQKLGHFGNGVVDFFSDSPRFNRNARIAEEARKFDVVLSHVAKLRKSSCYIYYVTTGGDHVSNDIKAHAEIIRDRVRSLNIFAQDRVEVTVIGATILQRIYLSTKNKVTRTFEFRDKIDLPASEGIDRAFIGALPAPTFVELIRAEDGDFVIPSLFQENVRDWQDYNAINTQIRNTLTSNNPERFLHMNNGITIVAREVQQIGRSVTISDFQIVNGCQSSNVLFDCRDSLTDQVLVPLKIIQTRDELAMDQIIAATNSQTPVRPEQYFARLDFSRKLELFFQAMPEPERLYYERRDGQFDREDVQKSRVVSPQSMIRAYASVWQEVPHRTTRGYGTLSSEVDDSIFAKDHKLEPYYSAAVAWYRLENRLQKGQLERSLKPARYHLLLGMRLAFDSEPSSPPNSRDAARRADAFASTLWKDDQLDILLEKALAGVQSSTDGNLNRDHIRTATVTERLMRYFGRESAQ